MLKEYEFRTWKAKYRGKLLIQARIGVDKKAMKRYEHLNLEYPCGVKIARNLLNIRFLKFSGIFSYPIVFFL